MRRLVRTEIGLVATFAAAMMVAYIGLAISVSGHERLIGLGTLATGLSVMLYVPVLHDRQHREEGEPTHAVWGRHDRHKPDWWNYWSGGNH